MQSAPQRTVGGLWRYIFFIVIVWSDLWTNIILKWKAFIKEMNSYKY